MQAEASLCFFLLSLRLHLAENCTGNPRLPQYMQYFPGNPHLLHTELPLSLSASIPSSPYLNLSGNPRICTLAYLLFVSVAAAHRSKCRQESSHAPIFQATGRTTTSPRRRATPPPAAATTDCRRLQVQLQLQHPLCPTCFDTDSDAVCGCSSSSSQVLCKGY